MITMILYLPDKLETCKGVRRKTDRVTTRKKVLPYIFIGFTDSGKNVN